MKIQTTVNIGKLELKNPVLVASGTFGYAQEFSPYMDLKELGGIITKTITLDAKSGNPAPRIAETASGMLNAIGLQNEGIAKFLKDKMPYLRKIKVPVIVSIGGDTGEEYVKLARILEKTKGVAALELNISCPNVKGKECLVSQDKEATYQLVKQVRSSTDKTIITKLSPNVTDIVEIARAAKAAGSDAVSLVNTFVGMSINVRTRAPVLGNITGGLSGPAIKPIALRMVWQVAKDIDIPVIGMGGIMTADDAVEFLIAGASAICVGTANLVNPAAADDILAGLKQYLIQNKLKNIKHLIGSLQ
ncbi:MAG: dihydroorotate dehydrogenase [Candidatus Omnitrophica bacterium]|nr:dihydroorotate dehydrogenase [Candidatus Omnitrophota bacterium]MDD5351643.1 dihydroorotate dehydrogenase [Candidatus Omnitrophota bacterium]MDD5550853.1 dihydroorotate dehydrogenase [Candidatus Omnitrophota bacterium]